MLRRKSTEELNSQLEQVNRQREQENQEPLIVSEADFELTDQELKEKHGLNYSEYTSSIGKAVRGEQKATKEWLVNDLNDQLDNGDLEAVREIVEFIQHNDVKVDIITPIQEKLLLIINGDFDLEDFEELVDIVQDNRVQVDLPQVFRYRLRKYINGEGASYYGFLGNIEKVVDLVREKGIDLYLPKIFTEELDKRLSKDDVLRSRLNYLGEVKSITDKLGIEIDLPGSIQKLMKKELENNRRSSNARDLSELIQYLKKHDINVDFTGIFNQEMEHRLTEYSSDGFDFLKRFAKKDCQSDLDYSTPEVARAVETSLQSILNGHDLEYRSERLEKLLNLVKQEGIEVDLSDIFQKGIKRQLHNKIDLSRKIVALAKERGIEIDFKVVFEDVAEKFTNGSCLTSEGVREVFDFAKENGVDLDLCSMLTSGLQVFLGRGDIHNVGEYIKLAEEKQVEPDWRSDKLKQALSTGLPQLHQWPFERENSVDGYLHDVGMYMDFAEKGGTELEVGSVLHSKAAKANLDYHQQMNYYSDPYSRASQDFVAEAKKDPHGIKEIKKIMDFALERGIDDAGFDAVFQGEAKSFLMQGQTGQLRHLEKTLSENDIEFQVSAKTAMDVVEKLFPEPNTRASDRRISEESFDNLQVIVDDCLEQGYISLSELAKPFSVRIEKMFDRYVDNHYIYHEIEAVVGFAKKNAIPIDYDRIFHNGMVKKLNNIQKSEIECLLSFADKQDVDIDWQHPDIEKAVVTGAKNTVPHFQGLYMGMVVKNIQAMIDIAQKHEYDLDVKAVFEDVVDVLTEDEKLGQYEDLDSYMKQGFSKLVALADEHGIAIDVGEFLVKRSVALLAKGNTRHLDSTISYLKDNNLNYDKEKVFLAWKQADSWVKESSDLNGIDDFDEMIKFETKHKTCFLYLREKGGNWLLDKDDFTACEKLNLFAVEGHVLKLRGVDLKKESKNDGEKARKNIFTALRDQEELGWEDEENISRPFENGARVFGHKKMFNYIGRPNLSRHDTLHNFDRIIELSENSGLSSSQFYHQILDQVKMDGGMYDIGTAHHKLNNIASNINLDFAGVIQAAREFSGVNKLQRLLKDLDTPEKVFASWRNLKKYDELCQLLKRKEILGQLTELKQQGKDKLYNYIEVLAFHPNIKMQSVLEFWRDPDRFLNIGDSHTPNEVHNRKKPSNYTRIPNLDMTAEKLRDALVTGALDKLQAFRPLEIDYATEKPVIDLVKEALGSRKEGVAGKAKNPKMLFKQLNDLLKANGTNLNAYLQGKANLEPGIEEQLKEMVQNQKTGYESGDPVLRYRAKINLKSDPEAVVAGNDTACCMPFGSGKNNVYTFNPVCSVFTLQQEVGNGEYRTVAQSVLTKDKDIKKNIAEVLVQLHASNKPKIGEILPEGILNEEESVLACDNVEVSPKVKGNIKIQEHIEMIYRDFFNEYLKLYAAEDNLDKERIVIGKGYSDSLTHLPEVDNTYSPQAPVGYSDKTHDKVYELTPARADKVKRVIREVDKPALSESPAFDENGLSLLDHSDTIPVAFIEGKAYHDNENLVQYLNDLENTLIAKDINNVAEGRPNLSLKHRTDDGKINGYMIAYQGVKDESGKGHGQDVIYVADIATDLNSPGTGRSLMLGFLKQYKHHYIDQGKNIPIYTQAREQTSYAIIKAKLTDYAQEVGLNLEIEELGTTHEGDDIMHKLMIRPVI
ncbi:MAG: hypothetical protein ABIH87_03670 [bacterium]